MKPLTIREEQIMRCSAAEHEDKRVVAAGRARSSKHHYLYCIDASADDGPCGADGKLFKEKK